MIVQTRSNTSRGVARFWFLKPSLRGHGRPRDPVNTRAEHNASAHPRRCLDPCTTAGRMTDKPSERLARLVWLGWPGRGRVGGDVDASTSSKPDEPVNDLSTANEYSTEPTGRTQPYDASTF